MTAAILILAFLVALGLLAYFREPLRELLTTIFAGPFRIMQDGRTWASGVFGSLRAWCRSLFAEESWRLLVGRHVGALLTAAMALVFCYCDVALLGATMSFFGGEAALGPSGDPAWATAAALIMSSILWGFLFFEAAGLSPYAPGARFPGTERTRKALMYSCVGMFTLTLAVLMSFAAIRVACLEVALRGQEAQQALPTISGEAITLGIGAEVQSKAAKAAPAETENVALPGWVMPVAIGGTALVSAFGTAASFWGALPLLPLLLSSLVMAMGCLFWSAGAAMGFMGTVLCDWPHRLCLAALDILASLGEPLLRLLRISGRARPLSETKAEASDTSAQATTASASEAPRHQSQPMGGQGPVPSPAQGGGGADNSINFDPFKHP